MQDIEASAPSAVLSPAPSLRDELRLAARQFQSAVRRDPQLKILFLVDPIQAFADAGVTLSKRARRLIRRTHPDLAYGNRELYDAVRQGKVRLEWIQRVTLGRPMPVSDSEGFEFTDSEGVGVTAREVSS